MATSQTMFYATSRDTAEVLSNLESIQPLQYTRTGLFPKRTLNTFRSFRVIPEFGIAVHPTAIVSPSYLVSLQGETADDLEVPQRAGGIRYAVDQRANQNAILLRPGGLYGENVILYGSVATVSPAQPSLILYKAVAKVFRQKFTSLNEFLVGPEAMDAWEAGARLTGNAEAPPEFDLRRWERL